MSNDLVMHERDLIRSGNLVQLFFSLDHSDITENNGSFLNEEKVLRKNNVEKNKRFEKFNDINIILYFYDKMIEYFHPAS